MSLKTLRFTTRFKLTVLAAVTTLSFVFLIVSGSILQKRAASQLLEIQRSALPMLELGPLLQNEFEGLRHAFSDAVASEDLEGLAATRKLNDSLINHLTEAKELRNTKQLESLKLAIEDYYKAAYDVSLRSIHRETGEPIVEAMIKMQSKQARADRLLAEATKIDRKKLSSTFDAIEHQMIAVWQARTAISLIALIAVVFFAFWIGYSVLNSMRELTVGLNRFGKGDFSMPVAVLGEDEFSEVAMQANRMAERINGLMKELSSFSYSVAHDLRAPLRSMTGFSKALLEDYSNALPPEAQEQLVRINAAAKKMGDLIDGLLRMSQLSRKEVIHGAVDLSAIANSVIADLQAANPARHVQVSVAPGAWARGDAQLLNVALTNLLSNAWKFSGKKPDAKIEFGVEKVDGQTRYFVRDNGAGFDMQYSNKLFGTFQRLHAASEFEGTGIGLATVHTVIQRHHGKIWANSEVGKGSTFFFTLA